MTNAEISLPEIEEHFLPPAGWQGNYFTNPETDHQIYFARVSPTHIAAKGNVIILPGLSEFTEKYAEIAHNFINEGYNVFIIDWAYQGRSTRLQNHPHRRHSDGYEADVSDLHFLVKNHIKNDLPNCMLAHSMGAHIGLRYLLEYPNVFRAASYSAPMMGINDIKFFKPFVKIILWLTRGLEKSYVPLGKDWDEEARIGPKHDKFSSDPLRSELHNIWSITNPELQVGNPTLGWLEKSIQSIESLTRDKLQQIKTPVLIWAAGKERIVDNAALEKLAQNLPNGKLHIFPSGKHEIFMETDDIRDEVLNQTIQLFNRQ
jgi:lysophospholipase